MVSSAAPRHTCSSSTARLSALHGAPHAYMPYSAALCVSATPCQCRTIMAPGTVARNAFVDLVTQLADTTNQCSTQGVSSSRTSSCRSMKREAATDGGTHHDIHPSESGQLQLLTPALHSTQKQAATRGIPAHTTTPTTPPPPTTTTTTTTTTPTTTTTTTTSTPTTTTTTTRSRVCAVALLRQPGSVPNHCSNPRTHTVAATSRLERCPLFTDNARTPSNRHKHGNLQNAGRRV